MVPHPLVESGQGAWIPPGGRLFVDESALYRYSSYTVNPPLHTREEFEADGAGLNVLSLILYEDILPQVTKTKRSPLRPWAARARVYELHRRSNGYRSQFVEAARDLILGVSKLGFPIDEEDLYAYTRNGRLVLDQPDFEVEHELQFSN